MRRPSSTLIQAPTVDHGRVAMITHFRGHNKDLNWRPSKEACHQQPPTLLRFWLSLGAQIKPSSRARFGYHIRTQSRPQIKPQAWHLSGTAKQICRFFS